ncbi:MAG: PQQ-binding-like beta-propeller repeat protein [Actinomycetota bacterium]
MTRRSRGITRVLPLLALAALVVAPGGARSAVSCADPAPGGEWTRYGGDLQITRSQPAETLIDASNAGALQKAWHFQVSQQEGAAGVINGTAVIADGCAFIGTTDGWVFALNADSGEVVWATQLPVEDAGLLCTGIVGAAAVENGRVYVIVSQAGSPYLAALDQATGHVLWSQVIDTTELVYNCASPIAFDGIVIAAFNGDQTGTTNRGGWTIFDAVTGEQLIKTYTIDDADYSEGYRGGGVWATPAVDPATKHAYVGTSNPDAGNRQHPHTDAILKFDVDRTRPTFGRIVGAYQGLPERYLPLPDPPTCFPNDGSAIGPDFVGRDFDVYVRSVLCVQMDLDFGASPQIFAGPDGTYVGALQKAGVYHVARADTMQKVWTAPLAPPFFYGNASTAATDGTSIFVGASLPGHMVSLTAHDGAYEWISPIVDLLHYNGVAYANGLVYTTDTKGFLDIYRAADGVPVAHRPMHADVGALLLNADVTSAGVAIARNTVYAAANEFLIAYRP